MIHKSSVVDPKAKISKNVKIGPFCYVGPNVILDDNVELVSNVHIEGNTKVGKGTKIFPFASIGTQPQDLKFKGEKSNLIIGRKNTIREYVTMNPGTEGGGDHSPDGEWYYGVTIAVNPEYRKRGIGHQLYELRKETVKKLGKRGIVAGGVIPGYSEYLRDMSADEYIEKVITGELYDSTLSFQLQNGFEARGAIPNYLDDPSVGNNAVLIVWENPDYQA